MHGLEKRSLPGFFELSMEFVDSINNMRCYCRNLSLQHHLFLTFPLLYPLFFFFSLSPIFSACTNSFSLSASPLHFPPPPPLYLSLCKVGMHCFTEHVNGKMTGERWLMTQHENKQKFGGKNEIGYLRVYTAVGLCVGACQIGLTVYVLIYSNNFVLLRVSACAFPRQTATLSYSNQPGNFTAIKKVKAKLLRFVFLSAGGMWWAFRAP